LVERRFSRNVWDIDEVIAARALDLSARELLITGQVLVAMGALKFEFIHDLQRFPDCNGIWIKGQARF